MLQVASVERRGMNDSHNASGKRQAGQRSTSGIGHRLDVVQSDGEFVLFGDREYAAVLQAEFARLGGIRARGVDLQRFVAKCGAVDDGLAVGRKPRRADMATTEGEPGENRRSRLLRAVSSPERHGRHHI